MVQTGRAILRVSISRTTIAFLVVLAYAAPAASQDAGGTGAPKINYTTYSDEQLAAAYDEQIATDRPDWCRIMEPLTHQMVTRGSFGSPMELASLNARMVCAAVETRGMDAFNAMLALERKLGRPISFSASSAIATMAEQYDVAEQRLLGHIDAEGTESFSRSETQVLWNLSQSYDKAKLADRRLGLFRELSVSTRLAKFDAETRDDIVAQLFGLEAEAGHVAEAAALLPRLRSPVAVKSALVDRRYAALWPHIETAAGPNMTSVLRAVADRDQAIFDANPESDTALGGLATSYLINGRFDDVLSLVAPREPDETGYQSMSEDMAWALNAKAYALDALGRPDEAEILFERFATVKPEGPARGWAVNFIINRAIRYVDLGEAEKALAAADFAETVAAESGNDFARMLVRRAKICALAALGHTARIQPVLDEVVARADDAPDVAAAAMLCAKADDKAAEVVLAALRDPARSKAMIDALQAPEFELYGNESTLPSLAERMRKRSDVAPWFDKLGRDMPQGFVPLFHARRTELRAVAAKGG